MITRRLRDKYGPEEPITIDDFIDTITDRIGRHEVILPPQLIIKITVSEKKSIAKSYWLLGAKNTKESARTHVTTTLNVIG